jgi:hypothetical protein
LGAGQTQRSDGHVVNANGTIATGQVAPANTGGNNLSGGTQGNNSTDTRIPTTVYVPVQSSNSSNNVFIQLPGYFRDGVAHLTHNENPVPLGSIVQAVGGGWALTENGRMVERVNKPSNVLNEDLGGIQLVGSSSERSDMLRHLNELTDHTLVMSNITPELSIVYISRYAQSVNLPSGNRLISNLLRNPNNHTTFITYNNRGRNLHTPGINNTSLVQIDPRTELQLMIIDPVTGNVREDSDNIPIKMIFAHELIHAHRFMRGVNIDPSESEFYDYQHRVRRNGTIITLPEYVQKEELATIGLKHNVNGDITENMIREEHGLLLRGRYQNR